MFDGDFRPQRRIDLGSGSGFGSGYSGNNRRNKKNRPSDKVSVLETARRLREERKQFSRKQKASTQIQKHWRGYHERWLVCREWTLKLSELSTATATATETATETTTATATATATATVTAPILKAIGLLLSPGLFPLKRISDHVECLTKLESQLSCCFLDVLFPVNINDNNKRNQSSHSSHGSNIPWVSLTRIAHTSLRILAMENENDKFNNSNNVNNNNDNEMMDNTEEEASSSRSSSLSLLRLVTVVVEHMSPTLRRRVLPPMLLALQCSLNSSSLSSSSSSSSLSLSLLKLTNLVVLDNSHNDDSHNIDSITQYATACYGASVFSASMTLSPETVHETLHPQNPYQHLWQFSKSQPNSTKQMDNARISANQVFHEWALSLLKPLAFCLCLSFPTQSDTSATFTDMTYHTQSRSCSHSHDDYLRLLHTILSGKELLLLKNALPHLSSTFTSNQQPQQQQQKQQQQQQQQQQQADNCQILVVILHLAMNDTGFANVLAATASGYDRELVKKGQNPTATSVEPQEEDSDDDNDDEDDDDKVPVGAVKSSSLSPRKKVNRADYLTIPKLDKLFSQYLMSKQRQKQIQQLLFKEEDESSLSSSSSSSSLTLTLASQLCKGPILLQLGLQIFASSDQHLKLRYTEILSQALLLSNVKKAHFTSPILSHMALSPDTMHFLQTLWKFSSSRRQQQKQQQQQQQTFNRSAQICFTELLYYFLLAKDDEEFLDLLSVKANTNKMHTDNNMPMPLSTSSSNSSSSSSSSSTSTTLSFFVITDVIHWLKLLLQDMLWSNPVLSKLDAPSAEEQDGIRCLLSATKLYNSLYERWCRLRKIHMFCAEEDWWFPQHKRFVGKIRDGEEVILTSQQSGGEDMQGDDDDIDDDIDNNIDNNDGDGGDLGENVNVLANSFCDARIARLLTAVPQALPFDRRAALFQALLEAQKNQIQNDFDPFSDFISTTSTQGIGGRGGVYTVRRDNLYHDSMQQLNKDSTNLKGRIQIKFVNEMGMEEAGVDGGGLLKEFLDDLIKEAFRPDRRNKLFSVNALETLHVSHDTEHLLDHYVFLGRVLGKAVYEGVLVEPQFCLPFLNTLLGKQNTLDDLQNLDPLFYRHLRGLRKLNKDQIDQLCLNFELLTL